MSAPLIHHLTSQNHLPAIAVVCGDQAATHATWDLSVVTCEACNPVTPTRRTRTGGMTEKALQEALRQACVHQGWMAYHVWESRKSPAGWPDLVALRGPRLLVAECKSATGTLTDAQQRWLAAWRQIPGAEVHLVRPEDLEWALEVLR